MYFMFHKHSFLTSCGKMGFRKLADLGLFASSLPPHTNQEIIEFTLSKVKNSVIEGALDSGIRLTFSSVLIEKPRTDKLLESAAKGEIHSRVARALNKHSNRDSFWGEIQGNPSQVNKQAMEILTKIINESTWWNCFEHFKHQLVLEFRLASGHGARWHFPSLEFIGFVEPF